MQDGTLTVELAGASSRAWKTRFQGVLALLETPHSKWGEVVLTKEGIAVAEVRPGSESELRHFLESAVLQADSDTAPGAPRGRDHDTEHPDDRRREQEEEEQMEATFRSFVGGLGRVKTLMSCGECAFSGPFTGTGAFSDMRQVGPGWHRRGFRGGRRGARIGAGHGRPRRGIWSSWPIGGRRHRAGRLVDARAMSSS